MIDREAIKNMIIREISNLSEERLNEVLDFAAHLSEEQDSNGSSHGTQPPENDPILKFIGGVSHGLIARDLDSELYGG